MKISEIIKQNKDVVWGGIIGVLIVGLPSYLFLIESSLNYMVLIGSTIGVISGILITSFILWFIKKSIFNLFSYFAMGLVSGIITGLFWTLITGLFTKWWGGWAFVFGVGACTYAGLMGLLFAPLGFYKIRKSNTQKNTNYKYQNILNLLILLVILIFFVIPTLLILN